MSRETKAFLLRWLWSGRELSPRSFSQLSLYSSPTGSSSYARPRPFVGKVEKNYCDWFRLMLHLPWGWAPELLPE